MGKREGGWVGGGVRRRVEVGQRKTREREGRRRGEDK